MGNITYKQLEQLGLVDIEVVEDIHWSKEQMVGSMYEGDPEGEQEYLRKLRQNGVWSVRLLFRPHRNMPFSAVDSLHGIDDYNYADEWVRAEMQEKAVILVNDLISRLTE